MENLDRFPQYAPLSRLSTQRLEEILRDDFSSPEHDGGGLADYIMEVISGRESGPDDAAETQRAWREFQELYNTPEGAGKVLYPAEERGGRGQHTSPAQRPAPVKGRRVRRALLIAAAMAVVLVALVPPALGYEGFREMIGQWTDSVFRFEDTGNADNSTSRDNTVQMPDPSTEEYTSLQEALEDYGITDAAIPRQIPSGFILRNVVVFEMPEWGSLEFSAFFKRDGSPLAVSVVSLGAASASDYEKDSSAVEEYYANGITVYIFNNKNQKIAAWNTDGYECSISGDISAEELKEMIDSIE